jgi:hypothetical protein
LKKGIKIAIIVAASTIVVGAALFNGLYFGVVMRDRPFSITITDIDPSDMGPNEWEEDFLALYDMVKDNYPFLAVKERTHGYDWLDLKDHFLDRISEVSSNQEFLAVIYDAVQALQNLHTHIVHPSEASYWGSFFEGYSPYQDVFTYDVTTANAYWGPYYNMFLDDNIRVVYKALPLYDHGQYVIHDGVGDWAEEYGNRSVILAVNDVPIDEAVENCYEKGYLHYDFIREKHYLQAIYTYHFGADAVFTIQNTTGHIVNRTISSTFGGYFNPWNYPIDTLQTEILENDTTAYIHIQTFTVNYSNILVN